MLFLNMKKFVYALESIEEATGSEIIKAKERVIRLLMGDEDFLAEQTLESIAEIINHDTALVFDEYERVIVMPSQLEALRSVAFHKRRRLF